MDARFACTRCKASIRLRGATCQPSIPSWEGSAIDPRIQPGIPLGHGGRILSGWSYGSHHQVHLHAFRILCMKGFQRRKDKAVDVSNDMWHRLKPREQGYEKKEGYHLSPWKEGESMNGMNHGSHGMPAGGLGGTVFFHELGHLGDIFLHGILRGFALRTEKACQLVGEKDLPISFSMRKRHDLTFLSVPSVPLCTSFRIKDVRFRCDIVVFFVHDGSNKSVSLSAQPTARRFTQRSRRSGTRKKTHMCCNLRPWPA